MKTVIKQDNFNINILQTKKYKSTKIIISFANDLKEDTVTKRAVLPYLLRAVSKKYETRVKLSSYLDNLYAAQFGANSNKIGLTHLVNFSMSVINDKYTINQESLFETNIELLHEIIFNPLFLENIFEEEVRLLKEYFLSNYSNKLRFTIKQLHKIMFKDEPYLLSALGLEEHIDTLTLDSVIKEYENMIKNDKITVSIVGDVNVENIVAIINKHLPFENRSKKIDLFEQNNKEITTVKEEIIVQDVQQAKLAMGYRFDVRYLDDDYYPAIVFNSLLGSSSDSLLHMRIREELGLVYFINSSYDFYKGVLFIFSGIDASKYEIVQEEIVKIITNIELGKIDLKFLEIAKLSLINSIIESHDSIGTQAVRLERQDFFNNEITKEKSIEFIQAVTLEDIKKVASKVSLDTKVLLRGENNE